MTEFHTVKRIDNTRLVRPLAPNRLRELARLVALSGAFAAVALGYAWQHYRSIELRYQLEELKAERAQAAELNQKLKLEVAGLRSPMRIDVIARRDLGLTVPVPGQVGPVQGAADGVLAQARPDRIGARPATASARQ